MDGLSTAEVGVVKAIVEKARTNAWSGSSWVMRGWRFNLGTTRDPVRGRVRWRFESTLYPGGEGPDDRAWRMLGQILGAVGVPLDCLGWWVPERMPFVAEWDVLED